ncbi:hypothetical protein [Nocardia wallacei]|uniref:hypothetical protein n=1 Tax=Nocardia wallacei TaxID=480035 RepID=UPI002455C8FA|nr:hypothetical protein [Nocardia wallacei]
MDQPALVEAVETLTRAVGELRKELAVQQGVVNAIKKQGRDIRSTRITVWSAAVVVTVFLAGFGFLYHQVDRNQDQLQAVQARTSTEILCPLYQVLAVSIKVNPPSPNLNPEQVEARRRAADTILGGLDKLGCA